MAKKTTAEHGRGEIRDNALKALVTSKLFQMQVVKAKKAKAPTAARSLNKGRSVITLPFLLMSSAKFIHSLLIIQLRFNPSGSFCLCR